MSGATEKAKWVGMRLLHIPLYLVTSYVMRSLLGGGYRLLVKAGANLPPNFLLQHFLFVAIIDGFLAGLLGGLTIRTMLLLPISLRAIDGPALTRPQAWTWILGSCWFAWGLFVWIASNAHPSVLATSSDLSFSRVIRTVFGSGCDLSVPNIDNSFLLGCMTQLAYTHPWLGTISYSVAAFVPVGWTNRLRNSPDSTEGLETSSEVQSRSGEAFN
jgi:hypothetical protein